MPDLSRFASLAASIGQAVPPAVPPVPPAQTGGGTASIAPKPAENRHSLVAVPPVPPVPPENSVSVQELQAEYEERAAIMEFDGGLSRAEAERLAWAEVYGTERQAG